MTQASAREEGRPDASRPSGFTQGVGRAEAGAILGYPAPVGHAHTGCRAVPAEHGVARRVDRRQVGQLAIGRDQRAGVAQPQLLLDVDQPAVAEALERQHVHAPCPEQAPQRALESTRVRAGQDADAVHTLVECRGHGQRHRLTLAQHFDLNRPPTRALHRLRHLAGVDDRGHGPGAPHARTITRT